MRPLFPKISITLPATKISKCKATIQMHTMPIIKPSTLTLIKRQHFYSSYYKCEIPLVIYNIDATCMSIVSIYAYTQKIGLHVSKDIRTLLRTALTCNHVYTAYSLLNPVTYIIRALPTDQCNYSICSKEMC